MKDKRKARRKRAAFLPIWNKIFLDDARVLRFYEKLQPSLSYKCADCGAQGVKLWRIYQSSYINLLCLKCAEKESGRFCRYSECAKKIIELWESQWKEHAVGNSMMLDTDEKRALSSEHMQAMSDQMGSYVPAVPTNDDNYWGYTSVPGPGCRWWESLPLRG